MAMTNQTSEPAYEWPVGSRYGQRTLSRESTSTDVGRINVGKAERVLCGAAGALLLLRALARRDLRGLVIGAVGGALVYRGATAHCPVYESLGIDTAEADGRPGRAGAGLHVAKSCLIDRPAEELYAYWRNFENLPSIMTHLEAVRVIDDRRSRWVAKAPRIAGGRVEWDAEITADEPDSRIAWRSLPGADVQHEGSVEFTRALGDRGTVVRVDMQYQPPAGQLGRWIAKLFGEEPEQQIRDDLRNFKRVMEIGEVLTLEGQPRGTCLGRGTRTSA